MQGIRYIQWKVILNFLFLLCWKREKILLEQKEAHAILGVCLKYLEYPLFYKHYSTWFESVNDIDFAVCTILRRFIVFIWLSLELEGLNFLVQIIGFFEISIDTWRKELNSYLLQYRFISFGRNFKRSFKKWDTIED